MTFEEAQDNVKIGHFTRKGGTVRGVVHVGANDGEEVAGYLGLGAQEIMLFEPLPLACDKMFTDWKTDASHPSIHIFPFALGAEYEGDRQFNITAGDGKGSSFLREINSPYELAGRTYRTVRRFDSLDIDLAPYNVLVVDVQGMELEVLEGFGTQLESFDFMNIECSRVPLYEGEAPARAVIDFLSEQGFQQDSPIEDHNDIMFVARRLGWTTQY